MALPPHPLLAARIARGWSQAALARRLRDLAAKRGHPVATRKHGVSTWQSGRQPDPETQQLLAEVHGIPATAVDAQPWPD